MIDKTTADVNVEDMDERAALHIAANAGAYDVVSCLLMAKPNLDKVNGEKFSIHNHCTKIYPQFNLRILIINFRLISLLINTARYG